MTQPYAPTPPWLTDVRARLELERPAWFRDFTPPPHARSRSAVLMLFGPGSDGTDVVLTERAHDLRSHAAQVSFPGGRTDPTDSGPVAAALREAGEEVGLDPSSVTVIDILPELYLHPAENAVTPVLAWWRRPHPIGVVDAREVARVVRAPVEHLLDARNRFTAVTPQHTTPGFDIAGLFVWGFTAMLLDHVFDLAGLSRPWDGSQQRPVPTRLMAAYRD